MKHQEWGAEPRSAEALYTKSGALELVLGGAGVQGGSVLYCS